MPPGKRFALKFEDWPAADIAAWQAARAPGDVLDPGAPASRWSPATVTWMSNSYGHWLAWLKQEGRFEPTAAVAHALTPENIVSYVSFIRTINASSSVADRIQKLMHVAIALAPDCDWNWLRSVWRRLKAFAKPARNKNARLVESHELFDLGLNLIEDGDRKSAVSPMEGATLYRNGLIIALLAFRPIRLKNLTEITLDRHLLKRGGTWCLEFEAPETKPRKPLTPTFPVELVSHLERYLAHHRAMLFPRNRGSKQTNALDPRACTALWVSNLGKAMDRRTIYGVVAKHTHEAFGRVVYPNLCRDAAATTIAMRDSKRVGIASVVLDHSRAATTERHYNQARSYEAAHRLQENIRQIRASAGLAALAQDATEKDAEEAREPAQPPRNRGRS